MRVRWTTDAADDLERICDYIAESRPESARRVAQSVVERIGTLERSRTSDGLVASRGRERLPSLRCRSSQSTKFAAKRSSSCDFCTERNNGQWPNSGERRRTIWSKEQLTDITRYSKRRPLRRAQR